MLDVRRLRVLSQLAAQGSFSAAADALGMTQSAVSQHIAALEREIGLPVVRRGTRPVELTEAGCGPDQARDGNPGSAGNRRARTRRDCRAPSRPAAVRLLPDRAGHPHARGLRAIPPIAAGRSADRGRRSSAPAGPPAGVRRVGSRRDLRPRSSCPMSAPASSSAPRCSTDRFAAVLPAAHPLARRRDAFACRICAGNPGSAGRRAAAGSGSSVMPASRQASAPRADFASDDYIAVQALVAAGLGVSVIPGLAVVAPAARRRGPPGDVDAPVRRICAAWPTRRLPGSDTSCHGRMPQTDRRGPAMTVEFGVHLPLDRFRRYPRGRWHGFRPTCARPPRWASVRLRQRPSRVSGGLDGWPYGLGRGAGRGRRHDDRHHRRAASRARTRAHAANCWRPCTRSPTADSSPASDPVRPRPTTPPPECRSPSAGNASMRLSACCGSCSARTRSPSTERSTPATPMDRLTTSGDPRRCGLPAGARPPASVESPNSVTAGSPPPTTPLRTHSVATLDRLAAAGRPAATFPNAIATTWLHVTDRPSAAE